MPAWKHDKQEHPSTYFVQDRSNRDELQRLRLQDQMMTEAMGGVLPEQPDPASFRRVLDIGCGTGSWLVEIARTFPGTELLIGVDVSERMLNYARNLSREQGVSDRVAFQVMDALHVLEFPGGSFDLVNQRLGGSYLRTWDWPGLIEKMLLVTRPGGTIRLAEIEPGITSTSPALNQLFSFLRVALQQAGHVFQEKGVIDELAPLLRQFGLENIQTRITLLEHLPGTPQWPLFYDDMRLMYQTLVPFFRKWIKLPNDYEAIYQQALVEMQQPDFVGTGKLLTAWGRVSGGGVG